MALTALHEIDSEPWKFRLYENADGDFFAEIVYNPVSYADALLLIQLTNEEKKLALTDRLQFVALIDEVQYHFRNYLHRGLDAGQFQFIARN